MSAFSQIAPSTVPNPRLAINAAWLMKLRWVAIVGQLTTIGVVAQGLQIPVRLMPLLVALMVTTLTNLMFTLWLRRLRNRDVTAPATASWNRVFTGLMVCDLVVLTALLYFTGGHANPFSLFYFVNLALSGIVLPASRAWLLTALSILSFAALLYDHVPLADLQRPDSLKSIQAIGKATLAQWGLLVAFATCSSVIVYFVTRLTSELIQRDRALRQSQMLQARSEKWEALGTLSAGAAHELATPLTTIAIASKEISRELQGQEVSRTIQADVDIIRKEVDRCRTILDRMSIDAGHATAESHTVVTAKTLMAVTLSEMSVSPDRIELYISEPAADCTVNVPIQSVCMALRGMLQNALDASADVPVRLGVTCDEETLCIRIRDVGPGMSADVLARADEPFFTTKEAGKGMGLGRFLARTILERLGGTFETKSTVDVGTEVTMRIPLHPIEGSGRGTKDADNR